MAESHAVALHRPVTRWPNVLGIIGIVLAAVTILDKAADLLVLLLWPSADWERFVTDDVARLVVSVLPPTGWIALTSLVWIGLSVLLLAGSLELRRRHRSGVAHCRRWAWLALGWIAVEWSLGLWWLSTVVDDISTVAPAGWQASAIPGILLALALMLAYPVFLLVWLASPAVSEEWAAWTE